MPTCEPCGTFYNPNSLPEDGTCPSCGEPVLLGEMAQHEHAHRVGPRHVDELERDVPWHFWVGVIAVVAYLGWRVVQGILLLF